MPITKVQADSHDQNIGSSDMAAILNMDIYRSGRDVQLRKLGQLPPLEPNDAMVAGTMFEGGVLDYAEGELGKGRRNQTRRLKGTRLLAHIDLIPEDLQQPVEAKTAGLFGRLSEEWGQEGTDEVPVGVVVQAHVHMVCMSNAPTRCYVAAFLGGRGFCMFHVKRAEDLIDLITDTAIKWWHRHIVNQVPVTDSLPSIETLAILKRQPNKIKIVPPGLMATFMRLKRAQGVLKKRTDTAQQLLLEAAGDAEDIRDELGNRCTYLEQLTGKMDQKAFRAAHPKLAAEFTPDTKHRVLRQRKAEV